MTDLNEPISKRNKASLRSIVAVFLSIFTVVFMISALTSKTEQNKSEYLERLNASSGGLEDASEESIRNASENPCVKNYLIEQADRKIKAISERDIHQYTKRCNEEEIIARQKSVLNE